MGFFSKATDDVADAAKDVAEDKIDDAAEATGMEDNAMVENVADKATEMSGKGIDAVAQKVSGAPSEEDDCCKDESCADGTCS